MCTGVVFWYVNEFGHQVKMRNAFPKEYTEAQAHSREYRYLYQMLKETKGPQEIAKALLPDSANVSEILGLEGPEAEVDLRLDKAFRVVLENRALDCS